jgi:hypothetical protein
MPEIGTSWFDERGWETGRCRMAQVTAPILDSTQATEKDVRSNVGYGGAKRTRFAQHEFWRS